MNKNRGPQHMRKIWFGCLAFLFSLFMSSDRALAHEVRPAIAELNIQDGMYRLSVSLNLEAYLAGIGPQHKDTKDSPASAEYERLRRLHPQELEVAFDRQRDAFANTVTISNHAAMLPSRVTNLDIPPVGDIELARQSTVTLMGEINGGTQALVLQWAQSFGPVALRLRAPSDPDGPPGEILQAVYLKNGEPSGELPVSAVPKQSSSAVFIDYVGVGFEHILPLGLDHILFVVGLFLLAPRFAPLAWQISSFTVAHTVTLALGVLGIVTIPPHIVEPLIAASIVYVGVENILTSSLHRWRPVVVFLFGLLHGQGFAGVLSEFGLDTDHFVAGLIGFNVGVELGQLAVIAGCFAVAGLWFRHKSWYRQAISIPASIAITLVGAWWCFERVVA